MIESRTACYFSMNFALLFRHDEMAQLKACHISELSEGNGLSIFIPRSKTDIFTDRSTAFFSDTGNKYSKEFLLKAKRKREKKN